MKLEEAALRARRGEISEAEMELIVEVTAQNQAVQDMVRSLGDGELAAKLFSTMVALEAIRRECERRGL